MKVLAKTMDQDVTIQEVVQNALKAAGLRAETELEKQGAAAF